MDLRLRMVSICLMLCSPAIFFAQGLHSIDKVQSFDSIAVTQTIKVGTESLYLSSQNGNDNYIFTRGGPLHINPWHWFPGPTENTLINEDGGRIGLGCKVPLEKVQIGKELTIHAGGSKALARNFYYDNGPPQTGRRIVNGPASGIFFGGSGDLIFRVAEPMGLNSQIDWVDPLRIFNDGRIGVHSPNPMGTFQVRESGSDTSTHAFVVAVQADRQRAFTIVNQGTPTAACPGGEQVFRIRGNGLVEAKEVCLSTSGWCDFVFENGYQLMGMDELKTFIEANGHLPGIPSAEEVVAEGQMLGEMNKLLLQKVEELTLYTLDQERRLKVLEAELRGIKEEAK